MNKILTIIFITGVHLYALTGPQILFIDNIDNNTPNLFLVSNSLTQTTIDLKTKNTTEAQLVCDDKVLLSNDKLFFKKIYAKIINVTLKKSVQLTIPTSVNKCTLKLWKKDSPEVQKSVELIKDELKYNFLKKFNHAQENCNYQTNHSDLLGMEKILTSNSFKKMNCATAARKITILNESKNSFLEKIKTLLGYKPSIDFINNQNPYAKLDFSKAPQLDAIFLSTLVFRRGFTGTVLSRLFKFHAKRGTIINIISTGYLNNDKDKSLLKELALFSPNIRIQEYKHHLKKRLITPKMYLSARLRNLHMKMLVTLSSKQPEYNAIIFGGRNIHDGFLFSKRPDFSPYPEMNQYPINESYAYWQDLEIKVESRKLAKSTYSHMLTFWNRDIKTQNIRDIKSSTKSNSIESETVTLNSSPIFRHFISIPYNDNHALEKLYVKMIDSAQSSIKLSTPYLRPTDKIKKAFKRAIDRGVDIIIQTRINLEGDTQAWLYEEMNKSAINDLYKKVTLYEWNKKSILHTKMIIIDRDYAFVGSVNLSQRSFLHDIEHGFIIHNEEFVEKLINIFQEYNNQSKRIRSHQKRKVFASILVSIFKDLF